MIKQYTLTEEELAKVITSACFGYVLASTGIALPEQAIQDCYEATIEEIQDSDPGEIGFIQELITTFDDNSYSERVKDYKEFMKEQNLQETENG